MQYKSNVELHFAAYISEIERLERDRRRVEPISYEMDPTEAINVAKNGHKPPETYHLQIEKLYQDDLPGKTNSLEEKM